MNFPTSPTLNQTYSLGDKTWKWNGVAWDLQSTGLTSAHVISALGYTPYNAASLSSALSPYLLSATASSTYLALAGGTLTGNLAFSGTGLRITGDFSNATLASRLMFQTSTTNGNTGVYVIPNGTSQISTLRLANNSDPTNAGHIQIQANSSEASVTAGISGSGAYLPLAISVGGSERGRFTTGGDFGIGTSSPKVRAQFSAGSAQNAPTLGTALGIAYFSNNDANYGLLVGNSAATGAAWLQAQRTDGTATAYDIVLNPAGGNLGLGVTPSAWLANNIKAIQVSAGGFANNGGSGYITNNAYYDTSYVPKYIGSALAQMISFNRTGVGDIQFLVAASGTAGNTISWTQAMTLDSSSNLTVAANITAYSDERLKTDWSALPSDFIERLAGVKNGTYTRIDNGQRQIGVGAQSLQPVAPDGVLEGEHLSVAYGNVALAAAVELAKRVVRLEAQINAMIGD